MYHVSVELHKHKWKFGRTRNALETQATGECFHSFFKFSQTFTSVYILIEIQRTWFLFLLNLTLQREKGKQLSNFDCQNVNSLSLHHHYINSLCQFCVSTELQKTMFNQSACIFSQGCFLKLYPVHFMLYPLPFCFNYWSTNISLSLSLSCKTATPVKAWSDHMWPKLTM